MWRPVRIGLRPAPAFSPVSQPPPKLDTQENPGEVAQARSKGLAYITPRWPHITPPSTTMSAAVMNLDSSEARKTAASATSMGWPVRAKGCRDRNRLAILSTCHSARSASTPNDAACTGVSMKPGDIALDSDPIPSNLSGNAAGKMKKPRLADRIGHFSAYAMRSHRADVYNAAALGAPHLRNNS